MRQRRAPRLCRGAQKGYTGKGGKKADWSRKLRRRRSKPPNEQGEQLRFLNNPLAPVTHAQMRIRSGIVCIAGVAPGYSCMGGEHQPSDYASPSPLETGGSSCIPAKLTEYVRIHNLLAATPRARFERKTQPRFAAAVAGALDWTALGDYRVDQAAPGGQMVMKAALFLRPWLPRMPVAFRRSHSPEFICWWSRQRSGLVGRALGC